MHVSVGSTKDANPGWELRHYTPLYFMFSRKTTVELSFLLERHLLQAIGLQDALRPRGRWWAVETSISFFSGLERVWTCTQHPQMQVIKRLDTGERQSQIGAALKIWQLQQ
ncbi:hypothetical protein TNCV_944141 [Trichonephila clavipes]|nr:hypothetical protein TNCV_944141 [Trichonephila clavipes]